ncbi:uncharacterized protein LOC116940819 [Petromyzon marinus]|uniref:uncharacterized protein LOC116940819 n=1 Tax=Petromyzon marinus TaxID=7757 RepID=UPI003F6FD754
MSGNGQQGPDAPPSFATYAQEDDDCDSSDAKPSSQKTTDAAAAGAAKECAASSRQPAPVVLDDWELPSPSEYESPPAIPQQGPGASRDASETKEKGGGSFGATEPAASPSGSGADVASLRSDSKADSRPPAGGFTNQLSFSDDKPSPVTHKENKFDVDKPDENKEASEKPVTKTHCFPCGDGDEVAHLAHDNIQGPEFRRDEPVPCDTASTAALPNESDDAQLSKPAAPNTESSGSAAENGKRPQTGKESPEPHEEPIAGFTEPQESDEGSFAEAPHQEGSSGLLTLKTKQVTFSEEVLVEEKFDEPGNGENVLSVVNFSAMPADADETCAFRSYEASNKKASMLRSYTLPNTYTFDYRGEDDNDIPDAASQSKTLKSENQKLERKLSEQCLGQKSDSACMFTEQVVAADLSSKQPEVLEMERNLQEADKETKQQNDALNIQAGNVGVDESSFTSVVNLRAIPEGREAADFQTDKPAPTDAGSAQDQSLDITATSLNHHTEKPTPQRDIISTDFLPIEQKASKIVLQGSSSQKVKSSQGGESQGAIKGDSLEEEIKMPEVQTVQPSFPKVECEAKFGDKRSNDAHVLRADGDKTSIEKLKDEEKSIEAPECKDIMKDDKNGSAIPQLKCADASRAESESDALSAGHTKEPTQQDHFEEPRPGKLAPGDAASTPVEHATTCSSSNGKDAVAIGPDTSKTAVASMLGPQAQSTPLSAPPQSELDFYAMKAIDSESDASSDDELQCNVVDQFGKPTSGDFLTAGGGGEDGQKSAGHHGHSRLSPLETAILSEFQEDNSDEEQYFPSEKASAASARQEFPPEHARQEERKESDFSSFRFHCIDPQDESAYYEYPPDAKGHGHDVEYMELNTAGKEALLAYSKQSAETKLLDQASGGTPEIDITQHMHPEEEEEEEEEEDEEEEEGLVPRSDTEDTSAEIKRVEADPYKPDSLSVDKDKDFIFSSPLMKSDLPVLSARESEYHPAGVLFENVTPTRSLSGADKRLGGIKYSLSVDVSSVLRHNDGSDDESDKGHHHHARVTYERELPDLREQDKSPDSEIAPLKFAEEQLCPAHVPRISTTPPPNDDDEYKQDTLGEGAAAQKDAAFTDYIHSESLSPKKSIPHAECLPPAREKAQPDESIKTDTAANAEQKEDAKHATTTDVQLKQSADSGSEGVAETQHQAEDGKGLSESQVEVFVSEGAEGQQRDSKQQIKDKEMETAEEQLARAEPRHGAEKDAKPTKPHPTASGFKEPIVHQEAIDESGDTVDTEAPLENLQSVPAEDKAHVQTETLPAETQPAAPAGVEEAPAWGMEAVASHEVQVRRPTEEVESIHPEKVLQAEERHIVEEEDAAHAAEQQSEGDRKPPVEAEQTDDVEKQAAAEDAHLESPLVASESKAAAMSDRDSSTCTPDVESTVDVDRKLDTECEPEEAAEVDVEHKPDETNVKVESRPQEKSQADAVTKTDAKDAPVIESSLEGSGPDTESKGEEKSTPDTESKLEGSSVAHIDSELDQKSIPDVEIKLEEKSIPDVEILLEEKIIPDVETLLEEKSIPEVETRLEEKYIADTGSMLEEKSTADIENTPEGNTIPEDKPEAKGDPHNGGKTEDDTKPDGDEKPEEQSQPEAESRADIESRTDVEGEEEEEMSEVSKECVPESELKLEEDSSKMVEEEPEEEEGESLADVEILVERRDSDQVGKQSLPSSPEKKSPKKDSTKRRKVGKKGDLSKRAELRSPVRASRATERPQRASPHATSKKRQKAPPKADAGGVELPAAGQQTFSPSAKAKATEATRTAAPKPKARSVTSSVSPAKTTTTTAATTASRPTRTGRPARPSAAAKTASPGGGGDGTRTQTARASAASSYSSPRPFRASIPTSVSAPRLSTVAASAPSRPTNGSQGKPGGGKKSGCTTPGTGPPTPPTPHAQRGGSTTPGERKKGPRSPRSPTGLVAPSNLKALRSKVGSSDNLKMPAGASKVFSKKLDFSHVQSKCGSMANIKHVPGGGRVQIVTKKIDLSHVTAKCGSKHNIHHKPGGGNVTIPSHRDKSKGASLENVLGEVGSKTDSPPKDTSQARTESRSRSPSASGGPSPLRISKVCSMGSLSQPDGLAQSEQPAIQLATALAQQGL